MRQELQHDRLAARSPYSATDSPANDNVAPALSCFAPAPLDAIGAQPSLASPSPPGVTRPRHYIRRIGPARAPAWYRPSPTAAPRQHIYLTTTGTDSVGLTEAARLRPVGAEVQELTVPNRRPTTAPRRRRSASERRTRKTSARRLPGESSPAVVTRSL